MQVKNNFFILEFFDEMAFQTRNDPKATKLYREFKKRLNITQSLFNEINLKNKYSLLREDNFSDIMRSFPKDSGKDVEGSANSNPEMGLEWYTDEEHQRAHDHKDRNLPNLSGWIDSEEKRLDVMFADLEEAFQSSWIFGLPPKYVEEYINYGEVTRPKMADIIDGITKIKSASKGPITHDFVRTVFAIIAGFGSLWKFNIFGLLNGTTSIKAVLAAIAIGGLGHYIWVALAIIIALDSLLKYWHYFIEFGTNPIGDFSTKILQWFGKILGIKKQNPNIVDVRNAMASEKSKLEAMKQEHENPKKSVRRRDDSTYFRMLGFSEDLTSRNFNLDEFEDLCKKGIVQGHLRTYNKKDAQPRLLDAQGLQDIICRGEIKNTNGEPYKLWIADEPYPRGPYSTERSDFKVVHTLVKWDEVAESLNVLVGLQMNRYTKIKNVINKNSFMSFFDFETKQFWQDPTHMSKKDKEEHEKNLLVMQTIKNWERQDRDSTKNKFWIRTRRELRQFYMKNLYDKFGLPTKEVEKEIRRLATKVDNDKSKIDVLMSAGVTPSSNLSDISSAKKDLKKFVLEKFINKEEQNLENQGFTEEERIWLQDANESVLRNVIRKLILECVS